jgi:hypothetical protein
MVMSPVKVSVSADRTCSLAELTTARSDPHVDGLEGAIKDGMKEWSFCAI